MSMNTMNPAEPLRVGVLPLARPTFDVPYAEQVCEEAWKLMEQIPVDWVGSSDLLFDAKSVESQLSEFKKKRFRIKLKFKNHGRVVRILVLSTAS